MNVELAQIAGLVIRLNARKRGMVDRPYRNTSACRFCRTIEFLTFGRSFFRSTPHWKKFAADPEVWIDTVTAADFTKATLVCVHGDVIDISEYTPFTGYGPRWLVRIEGRERNEAWEQELSLSAPGFLSSDRHWHMRYRRMSGMDVSADADDPEKAVDELKEILLQIAAFARQVGNNFYAQVFDSARLFLDTGEAGKLELEYPDVIPKGALSAFGTRLLQASQYAWVFGGMTSWNDYYYEDNEELVRLHEDFSRRLHRVLCRSICVAVNTG